MKLNDLIKNGFSIIQDDLRHDLKAGFRCRLLLAFDEPDVSTTRLSGHSIRVQMAIESVSKVLTLWESSFPSDRMPHRALELAERAKAGVIPSTGTEKEMGNLWSYCDDLALKYQNRQEVIMVGYGAIQAIREAVCEKHFGCEQVTESTTDLNIDPYDHDSSFCAAVAYCGGAPWEQRSDSKKRLQFWTWWLNLLAEYVQEK